MLAAKRLGRRRVMEARGNAGKFKILNRDAMKSLAILTMLIGHMVAWINLLCHPDNQLALYSMPTWLISLCGLAVFCPPVMFFITNGSSSAYCLYWHCIFSVSSPKRDFLHTQFLRSPTALLTYILLAKSPLSSLPPASAPC